MNFITFVLFLVGIFQIILAKPFISNIYLITLSSAIAIISAGFILSITSEVAQKDMPRSFATVFLALIAILPEYAVDIYLAYMGGKDPIYAHYALANMTGANRLLVGALWSLVAIIFIAYYFRKGIRKIKLDIHLEKLFLLIATIYGFFICLKGSINIIDSIVLAIIFFIYGFLASLQEHEEPEFEFGIQKTISNFKKPIRIITYIFLFSYSAIGILLSAKPFAEGLIYIGKSLGISEFFLIQWVAPFASESPEFVIVLILALRGFGSWALGTLISSEVNQLTLLVSTIPIAFSLGAGSISIFPLDYIQITELLLTISLSLFAITLILNDEFHIIEAIILISIFLLTFPLKNYHFEISIVLIILSFLNILRIRGFSYIANTIKLVIKSTER
ncbi:MAG: sodium:calcium antiporter [candidate division WOR-3 bacterium]